jgi:soluble calcium-activated nucleotidase 1
VIIQRNSSFPSAKAVTVDPLLPSRNTPNSSPEIQSPRSAGARLPSRRRRKQASAFAQLFPWTYSMPPASSSGQILPTSRSESMAYPSSKLSQYVSKMQYYARQHNKTILVGGALVSAFLVLLSVGTGSPFGSNSVSVLRGGAFSLLGGATRPGYFLPADAIEKSVKKFHFAAVTDLDELSKVETSNKPKFRSLLLPGTLSLVDKNKYEIELGSEAAGRNMYTAHNEAGRGAEFSELTIFQNRLYTFDDRTGDVFEILNTPDGEDSFVVPRFVITEGDGETDKGMKWEWATVKHGELYMGSMGKAYTRDDGTIKNRNNLWVGVINRRGELRRENWADQYDVVRTALGAMGPGYVWNEAVLWSDALNKWVFLPRRISSEAYDDVKDERRGGDKLVLVDPNFRKATVVTVKMESKDPLKGFSSFAFVPGTKDKHAIAIRTIEDGCAVDGGVCKQHSFFLVFDVTTGEVLSPEVAYEAESLKFEGVEFVNLNTKPPPS